MLKGKKALVYGGGTGIGFACAAALASEGAVIVLSSRREHVLREAAGKISAGKVEICAGDATSAADVRRITAAAAHTMGGIDTIVISAGAGGRTPIFDTPVEEFQRITDHSLLPVFLAMRFGAVHLLAAGSASVIAISSMYGLVAAKERAGYCAGKFGVIGLVKSAALDFADRGVRVNAICPGFIETTMSIEVANLEKDPAAVIEAKRKMHPIPRAGRLEEVGALAVYLASDLAAFTTGQAIAVDGGYSTR